MEEKRKRILLVEDEVITAMYEETMLKKHNYNVLSAYNGNDAVELVKKNQGDIDLILMDIDLGKGMDGTQAAQEILGQYDIPVLFLSSHTEPEVVEKTEKITSYGYIVKNSGEVVLLASIKMAFKLFEANKKIHAKNIEIETANEELHKTVKVLEKTNEDLKHSEKKLMDRESQYRLLADNMSDTVWLMDMDLKTVYISPSVLRTRGFTLNEINSMSLEDHLPPDSYRRAMNLLAEALLPTNLAKPEPRVNYSIELEFFRKDGSTFWSDIAFTLILDQNGQPMNILGCGRDITERKQVEEALRESEKGVRRKLDAILSPEGDIAQLELSDIIDCDKIQSLMDEFYELTNIGIGIIDLNGKVLVGTGWQDICTKFHRVNPESCKLCIESDLELSIDIPVGSFKQYHCKNNMWDIATPIMLGDKHVGNIFLGQFLFNDETPDYEAFHQQARQYGFNEEEYINALNRVPRWSREMVNTAMSFYSAFAVMIGNLSYSNVKLANSLEDRKRTEEELTHLNRELQAITNCNQALIRTDDEQALLDEICHIICDEAGYRMAWVGYREHDEVKSVRPVAWAGKENDYLEHANITWADIERGRGPTGTAIRSGQSACIQDFMLESQVLPWRESALKRGYRSSISLPLKNENGVTFGALNIYSEKPNAFTEDEIRLLGELADDLAFGITALRIRTERKQAIEDLQKSNDLLRAIIEAAPTALIGLDLDGRVHTVWNPAAEKMLGWSAEEAMGSFLPSVPVDKEEEFRRFRETIRSGKTLNGIDVQRQKRDGTPIEYSIYASPLYDMNGKITGNVAVLVDISERKRMEKELRQSEMYKSIMNRIQTIFLTDQDDEMYGHVLAVVREVLRSRFGVFGFITDNGDLVIPSLTSEIWRECNVTDKSVVFPSATWGKSLWGRAIREKKSFHSRGPFNTPEGHIQIENFLTSSIIYRDEVIGLISVANCESGYTDADTELLENICINISPILNARLQRDQQGRERARTEEALGMAELQLLTLMDNFPDLIARFDRDGRYLYVNPAVIRAFGIPFEQFVGKTLGELPFNGPPGQADELTDLIRQTFKHGVSSTHEVVWVTDKGKQYFEVRHIPEIDKKGRVISVLGIIHDITERKLAEEERRDNLFFFRSMETVNLAIQGTNDLEQMMSDVLDAVLSVFDCDRAFLLYPCDPGAPMWRIPMERTRPEYPGAGASGDEIPMDPDVSETLRIMINSDGPVRFDLESEYPLPTQVAKRFGIKSFLGMALHPKIGDPWEFGIHQCSSSRVWDREEIKLFEAVGRRLADGLTSHLAYRNLCDNESRFRGIYENIPIGYQSLDENGCLIDINQAWLNILGYAREEVISRWFGDFVEPLSLEIFSEGFSLLKSTGKIITEFEMKRKDGSSVMIACKGQAVYDEQNRYKHSHCVINDISIKNKMEREIISARDAWEKTFDALPDFVAIMDNDHKIVRVNAAMASYFKRSPSDFNGTYCYDLIHGDSCPLDICPHSLTLLDGQPHTVEIYEKRFDMWFIVNTVPLADNNGKIVNSVHVMKDITERKHNEAMLTAALNDKEILLRELQHRVKNSLSMIMSFIGLEKNRAHDKDSKTIFDDLIGRISSLAQLYESLHQTGDISKVQLDKYLDSVVRSIIDSVVHDIKSINIQMNLQGVVVNVKTAMAWGLIVNELLTNALKYAFPVGQSGVISIDLEAVDNYINLSVSDNGGGPPPDFNINKSQGLGMVIVKSLAQQLDGNISFNRGQQTIFSVCAPINHS